MTEARLSSAATFLIKVVVPGACAAMGGAFVISVWLSPSREPRLTDVLMRLLLSGIVLGVVALVTMPSRRLKQVTLVSGGVQVSNFRFEDFIPFEDIAMVRESKWSRHRDITLVLHRPCRFGRSVSFIPPLALFLGARDHPVAKLLRERAGVPHSRISRAR